MPSIVGKSSGSTASCRSRLSSPNPATKPLCMNSHRSCRNGWQLVCCTADPLVARTCARTVPDRTCCDSSRRFRSLHAGSTLRNSPGVGECSSYQPDAEPVAVGRLRAEPAVQALHDERVGGLVEELVEQHRRARVRDPAAHLRPPRRVPRPSRLPHRRRARALSQTVEGPTTAPGTSVWPYTSSSVALADSHTGPPGRCRAPRPPRGHVDERGRLAHEVEADAVGEHRQADDRGGPGVADAGDVGAVRADDDRGRPQRHEDGSGLAVVGHDERAAVVEGDLVAVRGAGVEVQADELGDVLGGRAAGDLGGAALLHDAPVLEHHQPVRQDERLERVVRDHQARPREARQVPLQLGLHVEPGAGVQRRQRLVEQQQGRVAGQRAAQRHALRLAAGQVAGSASRQLGQAEPGEPVVGHGPSVGPAHPACPRGERDVVPHAQVRETAGSSGRRTRRGGRRRRGRRRCSRRRAPRRRAGSGRPRPA